MTKERSKFITINEAAKLADCGPTFLHNRARAGVFTSQRVAGRVFIERESFLKWMELYQVRRHINPVFA